MTTNTYSTVIAHTTDAEFRAWGSALAASMQACGLVQTADTGQINWTTVTRPAINVAAGYEIYRFNDALQATAPIFMKIEYGTSSTATFPNIWLTVGTGSNGSGTLTGQSSTRNTVARALASSSTVTAFPTYVCVKNGSLAVILKAGSSSSLPDALAVFAVCRTTDDTGAETGDGYTVFRRQSGNGVAGAVVAQAVSVSNATTFAESPYYAMVHHGVSSSLVGADKQVYKCYTVQPRVRPVLQACVVLSTEYPAATSFTATLVGATARTYLSGGTATGYAGSNTVVGINNAFLYE
jgi:hypothetical protein